MPEPVKTSKAMLHLSKNILRKWPVCVVLSKGKSRLSLQRKQLYFIGKTSLLYWAKSCNLQGITASFYGANR